MKTFINTDQQSEPNQLLGCGVTGNTSVFEIEISGSNPDTSVYENV